MKRRDFLRAAGTATIAPYLSVGAAAKRRPNILFMFADDQAQNCLGCAGNRAIRTPNIDRLAADGVYFENAFVTTAICCSSRASILTGQYMRRHGIVDFQKPLSAEAFSQTYPALLRAAGYRTGYLGKFAVGWPRKEIIHLSLPAEKFDYWRGFPQVFSYKQTVDGETRYLTDVMADQAAEFLQTNPTGQPFCLTVAFKEPHGPYDYFDPHVPDIYEDVTIAQPETLTQADYQALPNFIRHSLNGSGDRSRFVDDPQAYQNHVRRTYRLVSRMDMAVGRIMSDLRGLGLDDNTVVIWTSDNGSFLGAHGLTGKWLMYEESIRIPLIIRDPRQPARQRGVRTEQMALNIDLAPTMLELAGVPVPDRMQGQTLVPVLSDSRRKLRDEWFYEHVYEHQANIRPCEGVRTADWKYVRFTKETPVFEQLFHLAVDPGERENLAGRSEHAAVLARLRRRCGEFAQTLV